MDHTVAPLQAKKIRSFTDLYAWQEGHQLVLAVYAMTKSFPSEERFGLTLQLRRAAVSITSNIAEGFRRRSKREKQQFYSTAAGSLTELQNQILIARDIQYIDRQTFEEAAGKSVRVSKLINGLMKSAAPAE